MQTNTYRAPSVSRALKILELTAQSPNGLGISQLARSLSISKGTVFGLCAQLEAGGALVRDPVSKRFSLGPFLSVLASRGLFQEELRELAGPEMTRVAESLGESVFLGVLAGERVTVIDSREPPTRLGIAAGPGTRLPLTAGAVGKVFLAAFTPADLERVLAKGLPSHTPHTITDPAKLRQQLDQVRRQGYSTERDEYLLGVWGAAAGLGMVRGGVSAALWVVGFTTALKDGGLDHAARALLRARKRILAALGQV